MIIEQVVKGDQRGQLVAIESGLDIPFEIKRVFYIYGTEKNIPRGQHAHCKTSQYLVAVSGSCKVTLDNGYQKQTYCLNQPNIGLIQGEMIWGEMHDFSYDCVLVVMASHNYDSEDYIHSYADFIRRVSK